ncbi:MAG: flagellar hook protein FlgE [Phycisphaeraceae bacterium]|nr:MAG: flagellar hook protein FlgE [Phycisphaeraceae bacterium]
MASTTAMFSALSGMSANARSLDVIGNNIANVNTVAYKSSKLMFGSMFSRTYNSGSPPGDNSGGSNPFQIGLGVQVAGTQRNFSSGSVTNTGDARDLAIEGNGFFVVSRGDRMLYTRNGSFRPDSNNDLVSISGERLMGYGVDSTFGVITGQIRPVNIPLGSMTIAQATTRVRFAGNLDAGGALPTQGAVNALMGTATSGLSLISTAAPAPTPPDVIDLNSRLVDIEDPSQPGSDVPHFSAGQTLRVTGVQKGGKTLPDAELTIGATTTLQDLMDFMTAALGITTGGTNPDGRAPGVELDTLTGQVIITGNTGSANDLSIDNADIKVVDAGGTVVKNAFHAEKTQSADGESVRTTFLVYDSLGSPVSVDLTMVIDAKTNNGTTWRYYLESGENAGVPIIVGGGTVEFDTSGRLTTTTGLSATIDRTGTGAATPLTFEVLLTDREQSVTALDSNGSSLAATNRDGSPIGTLEAFAIGSDGVILGSFSNGLTRTLGQVVLATFSSPEGLIDTGGSLYTVGANSGSAVVSAPGTLSAGKILGGALELSNVDLGQEFIGLILAQTGYSAAARIISTGDELMRQLLALGR